MSTDPPPMEPHGPTGGEPAREAPGGGTPTTGPRRPTRKAVPLRLDPAVHAAMARWAGDELRSLNAQIEVVLRRALAERGRLPGDARPLRGPGRPPGTGGDTEEARPD